MTDKTVICGLCTLPHEPVHTGAVAGFGCASEVSGLQVYSGFGSSFDLAVHHVHGYPLPQGANICDQCMTRMLSLGKIVPVQDYQTFSTGHDCLADLEWTDVSGKVLRAVAA